MSIYIELYLLNCFCICYVLLYLTSITAYIGTYRLNIIISSIIGSLLSLLIIMVNLALYFKLLLILCLIIVMLVILKPRQKLSNFLFIFLIFNSYTFLIGGVIGFFYDTFNLYQYSTANLVFSLVPYGFIILVTFFAFKSLTFVIIKRQNRKRIKKFMYKIKIDIEDKTITLNCFLDSGNLLVDEKTNLPVIILSTKILKKLYGRITNLTEYAKQYENKIHWQKYYSVSGYCSSMPIITPEKITILDEDSKEFQQKNAVVGFVEKQFDAYDGLIGTSLISI